MTTGKMSLLALALSCALLRAGQTGQADVLSSAPPVFIENDGQWADSSARFALMGQSGDVLMKDSSLELDLHAQQLASGQENLPHVNTMLASPSAFAARIYFSPHPGDANRDGAVDVLDLGILATNWLNTTYAHMHNGTPLVDWYHADCNGDGVVDVLDLGVLASNWQATLSS